MPVKKFRRRYRRSSRRTLSTRNIYGNRSARSQANQIAALRRRITTVARAQRPEIKVYNPAPTRMVFSNSILSDVYQMFHLFDMPTAGTGDNQVIGDAYRLKSVCHYGIIEYFNNKGQMMHNSEPLGGFIRFIYFQQKTVNVAPVIGELITIVQGNITSPVADQVQYELNCSRPLTPGVTNQYRILGDYRYSLTPTRSHINFKHRLPIKWRYSLVRRAFHEKEYAQNTVWCVVVTSGLHFDTDLTEKIEVSRSMKIAYTDN